MAQEQRTDVEQFGLSIVYAHVRDQYDTIEALEKFLHHPKLLEAQDIVPLEKKVMDELLYRWAWDDLDVVTRIA